MALTKINQLLVLFVLLLSPALTHGQRLTAAETKDHIGERATVCGKVASAHYAPGSKGQPTFLDLDKPHPHEVFTILIWGGDREKFGTPESRYRDTQVCVTGKITSYRGTPEIVVTQPSQIAVLQHAG
jgi:hypothetical protein